MFCRTINSAICRARYTIDTAPCSLSSYSASWILVFNPEGPTDKTKALSIKVKL